ncbi:short-chain dehydrogenase/reductase SDR [Neoconidiobolus thromboides FSU 785]|nr:short-chain dehydrogenase/reductase SDR [Neoconidiobolus thromboides FSU 785]
MSLKGKTIFISGASRGIGKAIALRAARDGANVAIAAKTTTAHPKLPGTIYTAAEEVEKAGGKALPIICDIRSEEQIADAISQTVKQFGGLDILVNNASAISLTNTEETTLKKFDLMHQINTRGTWLVSKHSIPHLRKSSNPHILNLAPPLYMHQKWFQNHSAYTMAKYGMSMCVLGMSGELKKDGIAVNALWPLTAIMTAALQMIESMNKPELCRTPEIIADSAHMVFNKDSKKFTGNFLVDELFLRENGVTDIDQYSVVKGATEFVEDFFIPDEVKEKIQKLRESS